MSWSNTDINALPLSMPLPCSIDRSTNSSVNKVPAMQRVFQANPGLLIFEKSAQDRSIYKFLFAASTCTGLGAIFGIGQLALKKVSADLGRACVHSGWPCAIGSRQLKGGVSLSSCTCVSECAWRRETRGAGNRGDCGLVCATELPRPGRHWGCSHQKLCARTLSRVRGSDSVSFSRNPHHAGQEGRAVIDSCIVLSTTTPV